MGWQTTAWTAKERPLSRSKEPLEEGPYYSVLHQSTRMFEQELFELSDSNNCDCLGAMYMAMLVGSRLAMVQQQPSCVCTDSCSTAVGM